MLILPFGKTSVNTLFFYSRELFRVITVKLLQMELFRFFLLLNPVYATLFWVIVLNVVQWRKRTPKAFLGKFMMVAFLVYCSHMAYFMGQYKLYFYFDAVYIFASLAVFPLYHIYVRLLTVDKWFSVIRHGRYLIIPASFSLLVFFGLLVMGNNNAEFFYTQIMPGKAQAQGIHQYLRLVVLASRIAFIIQVIVYLFLNYRLINRHNKQIQNYYSNTEKHSLVWVQFFNISLSLTSVASIVAAYLGREAFVDNTWMLVLPSGVFSILLFAIGLLGNRQLTIGVQLVDEYQMPATQEEQVEDVIPGDEAEKLRPLMEALFEKEKIFKNPELKIWDLAGMLGTNRTYVSRFINQEYGKNFCSHVNYFRIQEVKSIIVSNKNMSNEQLAELCGFGSVNSLYRAFYNFEKMTLGQYRKLSAGQD